MSTLWRCGVRGSVAPLHKSGRGGTTVDVPVESTPFTNPLLSSSGASGAVPQECSEGTSFEDVDAGSCSACGAWWSHAHGPPGLRGQKPRSAHAC